MNSNFEEYINWNCGGDSQGSGNTNNCRFFDSDIYGGFQDINPEIFLLMGNLIGTVMSENMPFNVQNAVGNWITLIGQTILTYNAQQQYFQNGPGRYYEARWRNVGNPFCPNSGVSSETGNNTDTGNSRKSNNLNQNSELIERINNLEKELNYLKRELNNLR